MKNKILTLGFVFFILFIVLVSPIEFKDNLRESFSSGFVYGYGGGGPTIYNVESSLKEAGDTVTKSLGKDYGIKFKLNDKSHTIKINDIYSSSVKLEIASDTFYIDIGLGEIKKVDINGNDYYDMAITLESLTKTRAKVKFEILPDTEKVEAEEAEQPEPKACEEEWKCNEWGECADGKQTRECIDLNECNTIENKPAEEQECETEEGAVPLTGKAITQTKAPVAAGIIFLIVVCLVAITVVLLKHRKHKR